MIPKTANPEHMRANRELDFTLSAAEREGIDAMDGKLPPKT